MKLSNTIYVIISLLIYYFLASSVLNNYDILSYDKGAKASIVGILIFICLPMLYIEKISKKFIKWQVIIKGSLFLIYLFIIGNINAELCLSTILLIDFFYNFNYMLIKDESLPDEFPI